MDNGRLTRSACVLIFKCLIINMKRSGIRQTMFTIIACVLTAACVLFMVRRDNKKIAMVDAVQLFNNFKMKQELEAQANGYLEQINKQTDSLKKAFTAERKSPEATKEKTEALYEALQKAQLHFRQVFQQSNQSINEQVWKRLNPLIDEYGKQHNLRLIIGANGMGSVLYYDDFYDQTKELTDFINRRYEEGN